MKTAKTEKLAWKEFETHIGAARGVIQWKGTDVCMDLECQCGETTHVDGFFHYSVVCESCGKEYACGHYVEMVLITEK